MNQYLSRTFDQWIGEKCGLGHHFDQQSLDRYQLSALKARAHYAMEHSRFYRERYAGYDLDDPLSLPLISGTDIAEAGTGMVCMPETRIQRIVTMETTGTTGKPKRIYFSEADLELTVDFFAQGMLYLTGPKEKVFINMPGSNPDGLSDLLSRGLQRIGVEPLKYGLISDFADAAQAARRFAPDCIVGIPKQILALAEYFPALRPRTVLLSADNVPDDLRLRVEDLWHTEVFAHWGMRETGLGGAVECGEHDGYHIRHADLLLEIIDPQSGKPLPDGKTGEVVVSTLTREAMPLLRYRTGDISRLIPGVCGCGSPFKRLGAVAGHKMMEGNA
jgi:phenylacetate-CoA ligase